MNIVLFHCLLSSTTLIGKIPTPICFPVTFGLRPGSSPHQFPFLIRFPLPPSQVSLNTPTIIYVSNFCIALLVTFSLVVNILGDHSWWFIFKPPFFSACLLLQLMLRTHFSVLYVSVCTVCLFPTFCFCFWLSSGLRKTNVTVVLHSSINTQLLQNFGS